MIYFLALIVLFIPTVVFHPTKFIHKENLPKKGKRAILTSNHYSNWDPLIYDACLIRKYRFLSKKELFENKFLGWILRGIGAIPIDRENLTPHSYKEIMGHLKKNHQVFIFPEGTRNKSGSKELLEIKSGFLTFASKAECDIIPMVMYQKPKFLRKNYVLVGEPFKLQAENPKKLTKEELEENLKRYLNVMAGLRKELDEYVENKKRKRKADAN